MEDGILHVVVARRDVESCDVGPTLGVLNVLVRTPEEARRWCERVDIMFEGFDETPSELFEIEEVRRFVQRLDDAFPFWLFFLSKAHLGLQCIMLCFLPPYLTAEAKQRTFPEALGQLLADRWFPAMNHVCAYAGITERQIEEISRRVVEYIRAG